MRTLLPLTFCFVLASTLLLTTESTQRIVQKELPDPAKFPRAGATCQRRLILAPWVGTPVANTPGKFHCVFGMTICDDVRLEVKSEERESGTGMCKDFWDRHAVFANREICCDPGASNARCDKPVSWFGDTSGCKSLPKDPVITVSGGTATLYICGQPVFYHADKSLLDPLFEQAYRAALRDHLADRIRGKICCDGFDEAVRTGKPCNPKDDVDCDGVRNRDDVAENNMPDIDFFDKPDPAAVDSYPADYFPPATKPKASECDCRWELAKGELDCNPVQTGQHSYRMTWRCPSNGREVVLTNHAPATSPCEE